MPKQRFPLEDNDTTRYKDVRFCCTTKDVFRDLTKGNERVNQRGQVITMIHTGPTQDGNTSPPILGLTPVGFRNMDEVPLSLPASTPGGPDHEGSR